MTSGMSSRGELPPRGNVGEVNSNMSSSGHQKDKGVKIVRTFGCLCWKDGSGE